MARDESTLATMLLESWKPSRKSSIDALATMTVNGTGMNLGSLLHPKTEKTNGRTRGSPAKYTAVWLCLLDNSITRSPRSCQNKGLEVIVRWLVEIKFEMG